MHNYDNYYAEETCNFTNTFVGENWKNKKLHWWIDIFYFSAKQMQTKYSKNHSIARRILAQTA